MAVHVAPAIGRSEQRAFRPLAVEFILIFEHLAARQVFEFNICVTDRQISREQQRFAGVVLRRSVACPMRLGPPPDGGRMGRSTQLRHKNIRCE
jgi:hypothetical protein